MSGRIRLALATAFLVSCDGENRSPANYEALMNEIWGSAHSKAASGGKRDWAWTLAASRDFVPFGSAPKDSATAQPRGYRSARDAVIGFRLTSRQ